MDIPKTREKTEKEKLWELVKNLRDSFANIPDKEQGWNELFELIQDSDEELRRYSVYSLGLVFAYLKDKGQGWNDILEFTKDSDRFVQMSAASALAHAYPFMEDKEQAYKDLLGLKNML